MACAAGSHKVTITQRDGSLVVLDVPEGTSVLEAAIDANVDLPHDCKMGVCMTCPAKLVCMWISVEISLLMLEVQSGLIVMVVVLLVAHGVLPTVTDGWECGSISWHA